MSEDYSNLQKRLDELNKNLNPNPNPNQFQSQSPQQFKQDLQNKYGGKRSRIGCFSIVIPIIILAVVLFFFAGKQFIMPMIFPNQISGNLMDFVYVPETGKLWILTDGSFHYTSKTTTGSSYSIKSKGLFCKTWTYIFDPAKNNIDNKIKTPFDDLPPSYKFIYNNGKVWKVCTQNSGYDAEVYVYDAKTQEELYNTESFTKKYDFLNSGLSNLRIDLNPLSLHFDTKDGRNPVYFIEEDTMLINESGANKYSNSKKDMYSNFGFGKDDEGKARMKVYFLKGPESEVKRTTTFPISGHKLSKNNSEVEITDILPDKVFIEGEKLFSNSDCCVIFHQDVAGDNAKRLLSCVNSDGKIFWTKQQSELFDGLEGSKSKSFSSMFFIKSHVSALKSGNLVIFKFDEEGLIGFEFSTGKELWRLKI